MPTLTNMLAFVRDRLDEQTARQWTDTQLTRWINEGTRDLARRLEILQAKRTESVTSPTNTFTLDADILRIYRVEYVRDSDETVYTLQYRDFATLDAVGYSQVDTGYEDIPSYYSLWGYSPQLTLTIFPKPVENGDLNIYAYVLPDEVSAGSDNLDFPTGWEDLVYDYCEYSALRKDRDPRWQEAKTLYEQRLSTMQEQTRRWSDQAGTFVSDYPGNQPRWLVDYGYYG